MCDFCHVNRNLEKPKAHEVLMSENMDLGSVCFMKQCIGYSAWKSKNQDVALINSQVKVSNLRTAEVIVSSYFTQFRTCCILSWNQSKHVVLARLGFKRI